MQLIFLVYVFLRVLGVYIPNVKVAGLLKINTYIFREKMKNIYSMSTNNIFTYTDMRETSIFQIWKDTSFYV